MNIKTMRNLKTLCKLIQLIVLFILPPIVCGGILKSELAIPISTLALLCIYIMKLRFVYFNVLLAVAYLGMSNLFILTDINIVGRKILSIFLVVMFALTIIREVLDCNIREKKY